MEFSEAIKKIIDGFPLPEDNSPDRVIMIFANGSRFASKNFKAAKKFKERFYENGYIDEEGACYFIEGRKFYLEGVTEIIFNLEE